MSNKELNALMLTFTISVELPAAWFGITPHVSYYMFRNLEKQNKNTEEYFLFTAYGPLCLVILVILNSVCNHRNHVALLCLHAILLNEDHNFIFV